MWRRRPCAHLEVHHSLVSSDQRSVLEHAEQLAEGEVRIASAYEIDVAGDRLDLDAPVLAELPDEGVVGCPSRAHEPDVGARLDALLPGFQAGEPYVEIGP